MSAGVLALAALVVIVGLVILVDLRAMDAEMQRQAGTDERMSAAPRAYRDQVRA